jgi:hypothetical protein
MANGEILRCILNISTSKEIALERFTLAEAKKQIGVLQL